MKRSHTVTIFFAFLVAGLLAAGAAWAQVNAVDLGGAITDPQNAAVSGAKVTMKNLATNAARSVQTGDDGRYLFVGLAPGRYELSVEKAGFGRAVNPEVILEIGRAPELNIQLKVQAGAQQVTVIGEAELVETQRTAVSETVGAREIENLPINGRNYVNFTLINSQANRDSAPSIGAAPTSGLNFGGQRARSNEVSVDGADAVDNSVNGIRSTVSQEDVQEFQLIISNYMPEFGRATGGVINIVTKSGSNQFHGDVFGFLRATDLQARNPFSFAVNPATGAETPVKQSYTRAQYGTAFGGPLQKDKTFYFFSFEGTRRHETGFTDIGADGFDGANPATGLTPSQAAALAAFPAGVQMAYSALAASAGSVARTGVDPGIIASLLTGTLVPPGPRFSLPVPCPALTLTPIPCGPTGQGFAPLPASFVPLENLVGNYPIFEGTSIYSARIDHIWNTKNQTFIRGSVSPSLVTGIQVNAQNQNFGQNAGSRTSLQQYRDWSIVAQHNTTFSSDLLNEFRFQAARRGLHYGYSDCTASECPTLGGEADGSQVGVNITGFAFFGREPFSTVDRIERRYQWTDHLTYVMGKHTLKAGVDTNLIQLRSNVPQIFELNFGGLYNFGSIDPSALVSAVVGAPVTGLPAFTAIQAYGLGLPQNLIQGTGESNLFFDNTEFGAFVQDSWRITPRVTMNYGLRYDIEFPPTFTPFGGPNGLNAQSEKALNVVEGIPVYDNAFQPRLGIAWDPWGNGKTVIRAGGGIFFDHPLLAVAFDSTTADGARSSQLIAAGGAPSACGIFVSAVVSVCGGAADGPGNLNAGSLFQGVLNTTAPAGFPYSIPYLPNQQRFMALPTTPQSVFTNENYLNPAIAPLGGFPTPILPFTLPTAGNFQYGYATQANLTIEHDLGHNFKVSAGYQYTKGTHLNRPRNINVSNAALLDENFQNALAAGFTAGSPITVNVGQAPTAGAPCGFTPIAPGALGVLTGCAGPFAGLTGQYVSTPAVFNFFRPSGPNPSFAALAGPAGYGGLVGLASIAGYPQGFLKGNTPIVTPFSDVLQQESTGNSTYNGLTVNIEKRWSDHFQFLMSYTYSHAIDDSTDLQTLLAPQDNNNPQLERGNSTFDQRHRFVFSGVAQSPYTWKDGGWKAFLGDWVVAPIIEFSSGRPYTVLTGTDYNLDFGSNTDRPSVVPLGTPGSVVSPYIPGVAFALANVCPININSPGITPILQGILASGAGCTGNLGRNTFVRPSFQNVDLRISRKFKVNERFSIEALVDMFNLANRFNVGDVSPLCDPGSPTGINSGGTPTCNAGQPTAALDPRTFQFGLKIYW
ncbi:MAG TPA: carboxypeptidase regulatory-like domain-containing protein [Candidatus Acidoferrales bacterium]|nr:carboxypeptidase regulatory-like domain-containing protein [Candidatus Acidoferrales bacterium]